MHSQGDHKEMEKLTRYFLLPKNIAPELGTTEKKGNRVFSATLGKETCEYTTGNDLAWTESADTLY